MIGISAAPLEYSSEVWNMEKHSLAHTAITFFYYSEQDLHETIVL